MAAEYLLNLGHKRIAVIFPNTIGNDRARGRLAGAMEVLQSRDALPPKEWTIQAPYNIAEAKDACGLLFDLLERPSAILCGNDVIAQGAIFALLKRCLSVPDDVSVIGIGDFKGSKEMEPALTTIHFPANEIGELAGREMCQLINQAEGTSVDTALIRTKCDISLSIRDTCRAV